ncbi:MAG: CoA-binding protein [Deltaproteobacteria bacterium]|nr:CoA-binding protein [Deltaproteobacteria bacterium]
MSENVIGMDVLFNPGSVAVIGASEKPEKLGSHVMNSLIKGGFKGEIIPVNPYSDTTMGLKTYSSISDYGKQIDMVIVAVPAKLLVEVFRECADSGVKGVVLITAGFKEIEDSSGIELHNTIGEIADKAGICVIGPNTFGMINFHASLNASFTPEFSRVKKGTIALVSQSGGISHLFGFMAMRTDVGFSKIIGLGNRLNIDFAEVVEYLMDNDPDTKVLMLYMEGIDNPGRLMEIFKKHRGKKPVIINKTGSSEKGDQASKSHTGSMAGRHEIYMGAFRQAGILAIDDTENLLDSAKALAGCPELEGNGVAILSGQAGPGMAACDVCEANGLKIVDFQNHTQGRINQNLPPLALRSNPVDMGPAWYDAVASREIIKAVMDDENVNGILILIMFASANVGVVNGISHLLMNWKQKKPLVTCIYAPPGIWDREMEHLEISGALVNFPSPERAARAMASLWRYKNAIER